MSGLSQKLLNAETRRCPRDVQTIEFLNISHTVTVLAVGLNVALVFHQSTQRGPCHSAVPQAPLQASAKSDLSGKSPLLGTPNLKESSRSCETHGIKGRTIYIYIYINVRFIMIYIYNYIYI